MSKKKTSETEQKEITPETAENQTVEATETSEPAEAEVVAKETVTEKYAAEETAPETESTDENQAKTAENTEVEVTAEANSEETDAADQNNTNTTATPAESSSEPEKPAKAASKKEKKSKEDKKNKKEKKSIKDMNPAKARVSFSQTIENFQSSTPLLVITCLAAIFVMMMICFAVFFMNLKGAEKVLVPNVVGKKWDEAFIEMQTKELYPKINLRYSDSPNDEGMIIEQSPKAGAIVKGYSRITLVISRGVIIDAVGSYVGKNITEVQMNLQTIFAGQTKPLITLASPTYKPDVSDAGTILEQDPPEGSKISQPVTVKLVVSSGPNYENTKRPYVIGQSINDLVQTIARSKIVFDITSHIATEQEKPGTVVDQQRIENEYVPNYSRVTVEMAMPQNTEETVYGIFQEKLSNYPYPVPMKLDAYPAEGASYTIVSFNHTGGNLTIPYELPRGTTLVLTVSDKVAARKVIE